jgi:2-furoate---CoA ligase
MSPTSRPPPHPDFAVCDTSSVTKLGFAGAAMSDGLLKRVDAAFRPALFVNHYGSSEIYTFTTEPRAVAKPSSAGKAGLNQRIRVIEPPGERAAARGRESLCAGKALWGRFHRGRVGRPGCG